MNTDTYKIYSNSKEFELWPISESKFMDILYGRIDINNKTEVFIEEIDNKIAGFISIKSKLMEGVEKASIVFIFVDEKYRKRGIAKRLLTKAIDWAKAQGAKRIKFGGAAGSYFWPALPENLNLVEFFKKQGFTIEEGPVDMYGDITNFNAPDNVYNALKENNVVIEYSNPSYKDKILEFTKLNFPHWYEYYFEDLSKGLFEKVFFAHRGDEIIAISELWVGDSNWDLLFENKVGGGGALGVSKAWQGKGIGLAMKTWGTEILKAKGIKYVWISWTSSIGFYEKLGFKVWRKYVNARLEI